jgi:hypothetical protein
MFATENRAKALFSILFGKSWPYNQQKKLDALAND